MRRRKIIGFKPLGILDAEKQQERMQEVREIIFTKNIFKKLKNF